MLIFSARKLEVMDSGATITVLGRNSDKLIRKWNVKPKSVNILLKTADGNYHTCKKRARIPIKFEGEQRTIKVYIAPNIDLDLVLGIDFWDAFNIRQAIFRSISCLEPVFVKVERDSDGKDASGKMFHSLSPEQEDSLLKVEMDRLLNLKIIEPASAPNWLNPVIAVKKSNGTIRICMDAGKLNACTIKNSFPTQNLNRILEQIQGCIYISTIDLKDACLLPN